MLATVYTAALSGVDGFLVTVEADISDRMPHFDVVGLPDMSVKEARERIRTAIENSGFDFGDPAITVNLAPADEKKSGAAYDLPISLCLLKGMDVISGPLDDACIVGEMSLSGAVRPIRGALSMAFAARAAGKKRMFVPADNAAEASAVEGIDVYGVTSLSQLAEVINGIRHIDVTPFDRSVFDRQKCVYDVDFSDVKGQFRAKRAIEIAAAGGHNILLIGPPGTGKSMLAKRLPTILPPMTFDEAIETTKIHSISGILPPGQSLVTVRPFRSPHSSTSAVALAGGGKIPMPGECSLASNGVLFLDELPEFNRAATEILRQPLEDHRITISRAAGKLTFDANFMLVCAMNPCRCGYFGSQLHKCRCKPTEVADYLSKISGPLIDRIDIQVEVSEVSLSEIRNEKPGETSEVIRGRVIAAREFARSRYAAAGCDVRCNAALRPQDLRRFCAMTDEAGQILGAAFEKLGMSARGYDRILHVARTIADMSEHEKIETGDVAEALQLRSLDRKYWSVSGK